MKKRYSAYRRPIQRGVYPPSRSNLSKADILRRVKIVNGHWIWPSLDGNGYPKGGVHRRAYELWVGPIPKGAMVHHRCNVKGCVNPADLQAATRSYNAHMAYMYRRKQRPWRDLRIVQELHGWLEQKMTQDYGGRRVDQM